MSKTSEYLIELTDEIIDIFNLSDDDFVDVQDIIQNQSETLCNCNSKQDIVNYFSKNIICPHCLSLLGTKCTCQKID